MIYESDFNNHPKNWNFTKNVKNSRISTIQIDPYNNLKKIVQLKNVYHSSLIATDEPIWIRYLNNSTVHGFRYLTDPKIRHTER